MRRPARRTIIGIGALGLVLGALPMSVASATTGSADLGVLVYAPDVQEPINTDVAWQVPIENDGPNTATAVTVSLVATGGTITSLAESSFDQTPHAGCAKSDATHASCTFGRSLAEFDSAEIDVVLKGSADGTETLTAAVDGAQSDSNASNDTAADSTQIVTPPAASFSGLHVARVAGSDAVDVSGVLKAGSAPLPNEVVSLLAKSPATNGGYKDVSGFDTNYTDADGKVVVRVDGSSTTSDVFADGPITFDLVHLASPGGSEADASIDWSQPATHLAISAPHTTKFGRLLKASSTLSYAAGGAVTPTDGQAALQVRRHGSSSWATIATAAILANGKASFTADGPAHNGDLRVAYLSGSPGSASSFSAVSGLSVAPKVSIQLSPIAVPPGGTATVTVAVTPASSGRVSLLRKSSGGSTAASTGHLVKGRQTWRIKAGNKLSKTGFHVATAATGLNAKGVSTTRSLVVERHAGGSAKDHVFAYLVGGKQVRWNPCRAIHYEVNLSEAPKGGLADVKETLRRISQPTGFHFTDDGHTHYIPGSTHNQTEPLVIAWAKPSQTQLLLGNGILGEGGGTYTYGAGQRPHIVTGYAVLDSTASLTPGFGAGQTEGALLMHEIGHAMGLFHAKKPAEIMYPILGPHPATMYGAGDYRGLQLLGRSQGCL